MGITKGSIGRNKPRPYAISLNESALSKENENASQGHHGSGRPTRFWHQSYRCTRVSGDKYAAKWVVQNFARHGVRYEYSEHDRSALYANMLPLLTSGRTRLLDNKRLVHQLAGLERTVLPAGRERIDHVRGAHDDLSNACAGALTFASAHQPLRVSDACWRHVQAMAMQRRFQHLYGRV